MVASPSHFETTEATTGWLTSAAQIFASPSYAHVSPSGVTVASASRLRVPEVSFRGSGEPRP